ncbi:general substrate transporter [Podospora didyma]|uniref:General substrate transporter n=1 Tax=Podospora didyma TaxID=330526 RepID=A0AAE0NQG8_9PEZI|nr:general substrate transporter [Podospora didyma]
MTTGENDIVEAEPLLLDDTDSPLFDNENGPESPAKPRHAWHATRFQAQKPSTIVILLATLLFAVVLSGMMILVPMFRLMEDTLCHVHYQRDPSETIDERECKVEEVQKQLTYLGGISAMISSSVGLLASLPYGILADRIGRKPTFMLAYFGIILAFGWGPFIIAVVNPSHLYLVIFGPLLFLIGGGIPIAINSLTAMAADVSTESEKATNFLYLSFGAVLGTLVGPVIAGLLLEKAGPWLPIRLVFAATPLIFFMLLFIPETLPIKLQTGTTQQKQKPLRHSIREAYQELKVSLALLKNPNLLLTLATFLIQPALFTAYSTTLTLYVSVYFSWTLAQTSYILSPPLGILHLAIILVLPPISNILTSVTGRFRLSVFSKDLLLAKISLLFVLIGALLEGFSQEIVLFIVGLTIGTFGSANSPLCRAVATAYVEPHQTSRLYALISIMETSGAVIGGPVLAWCFNIGMSKHGLWKGLPWFYCAGLIFAALALLMFVRHPENRADSEYTEEDAASEDGHGAEEELIAV